MLGKDVVQVPFHKPHSKTGEKQQSMVKYVFVWLNVIRGGELGADLMLQVI